MADESKISRWVTIATALAGLVAAVLGIGTAYYEYMNATGSVPVGSSNTPISKPTSTGVPNGPAKPVEPPPPSKNEPPRISMQEKVEFSANERVKVVPARIEDESPMQLMVTLRSDEESLIPNAKLSLDGIGSTRNLTIAPVPGKWGRTNIRMTVRDATDLVGDAILAVEIPPPAFDLLPLKDIKIQRDDAVPAVPLVVDDKSPVPARKVEYLPRATGAVLADVRVENGVLKLTRKPGTIGAATVTVLAQADDGRESKREFSLIIEPPPPPPLAVGVKARVVRSTSRVFSDTIGTHCLDPVSVEKETEVTILEIGKNLIRVQFGDKKFWLESDYLRTYE